MRRPGSGVPWRAGLRFPGLAAIVLLFGCGESGEPAPPTADGGFIDAPSAGDSEFVAPSSAPAPPSPTDSFFLHPRFLEDLDRAAGDPDALYQPEATDWETVDDPLPMGDLPAAASPQEVLEMWAAGRSRLDEPSPEGEVETVTRLREVTGSQSTGAVLRYGFMDDSVAGEGWHLDLRRGDDGWYVHAGARRWFCRRGVTGGLCV